MLQLKKQNGAKIAINPEQITAIEELFDEHGEPKIGCIVYAGMFVYDCRNDFIGVYEAWQEALIELQFPDEIEDEIETPLKGSEPN